MPFSTWWSTPAAPSRWFSEEELRRSRSFHRPVRRVALARVAARLGLLATLQSGVRDLGTGETAAWWHRWWIAVLVALAWWLPGLVADVWFEYRHVPRWGHGSLAPGRFAVASAVAAVTAAAGWVLLWSAVSWVTTSSGVVAPVVTVVATTGAFALGGLVHGRRLDAGSSPGLQAETGAPWIERLGLRRLAERAGRPAVRFCVSESGTDPGEVNARTSGLTPCPVVELSPGLLTQDERLVRFVVAHELGHLRLRHTWVTFGVLTTLVAGGSLAVVAGLVGATRRLDPGAITQRWWPSTVVVLSVGALAVSFAAAFVGRAQERRADDYAVDLLGGAPPPLADTTAPRRLASRSRPGIAGASGHGPPDAGGTPAATRLRGLRPRTRTSEAVHFLFTCRGVGRHPPSVRLALSQKRPDSAA